ncbi:MAG TPA: nucleotidyl transferase AbiEii/AbiGii toxin family protein [Planctomycetota bacterium]
MNDPISCAASVYLDLARLGVRCALVGGIAVGLRTRPRTTKDVDFSVAVASDRQAEQVVHRLCGAGYTARQILQQIDTGRLATVRLLTPAAAGDEPDLDLLFAACGIEREIVDAAEPVEIWGDVRVPIAAIPHLIAMKVLAENEHSRSQDRVDLMQLISHADDAALRAARACCELISGRGFARDKDLLAVFEALLTRAKRRI